MRMMTVAQVSKRTGVSVRTLHHYDQIGLLKPTEVTEAGYRLYDDGALDKLYMILVYRELGLRLNEIGSILDAPDYDRNRVLEHQIQLMQMRIEKLQNRISFARGMLMLGGKYMDFFNSAVGVLQTLVIALGAGLGIWGVINLLEGYGNDNPGAKSQGMKQLMAGGGVALIGITLVPLLSGLFTV